MSRIALLLAVPVLLASAPARAQGKDECIGAYEQTQTLRKDGKLVSAKAQASICARAECPAILAKDCSRWLGELETNIPTVVFDVRSPKGTELVDVRVKVDGAVLTERLDGKALHVDPGTRTFVFEADGGLTVEKMIVVKEGEKNRRIAITMAADSTAPAHAPAPGDRPIPMGVFVFGGVAVVALATSAVFAIDGLGKKSDLDGCKPHCSSDDVDAMSARFTFADVALGAGVMAGAAALWLYLTRPTSPVEGAAASASHARPYATPISGGGTVGIGGAF